ncbi:sigma factor rpoe regulatory protein rsec [hydrocarbon metagenome]|uniref:Sigma factor rpoe regulatory protein rsec n=1 Tax=hydrocarbon metagenome TaxID=938273 RepID=A0A0W8G002_9ZZZZ
MQSESIIEKGIVLSAGDGHAEIALIQTGSCEECSAKIFCKPSENKNSKIIEVEDSFGVKAGDEVDIQIKGSDVLKASFMLYGMPLILIVVGIIAGMNIFTNAVLPELLSFIFGIGLTALYFGNLLLINKFKHAKPKLPRITFVERL